MTVSLKLSKVRVKREERAVIEPNDTVPLHILLKNVGTSHAKKTKGRLNSNDPSITVKDDLGGYKSLKPEEVASGAYKIKTKNAELGFHYLNLNVNYTTDEGELSESLRVPIVVGPDEGCVDFLGKLDTVLEKSEGAKYRKVDLHVHTPASECCRFDPKGEPMRFVNALLDKCVEAGMDILALTDHNSPGHTVEGDLHSPTYYELVRKAVEARGLNLEILPGTELTANGIHILAVFPPDRYASFNIASLLLDLGVPPEQWGQSDTVCERSPTVVFDQVAKRGGVAIPAHVDSANGLLDKYKKGQEFIRIIKHPAFFGVEYVGVSRPRAFVKYEERHRKGRSLAYLKGSDNHMSPPGKKDLGKAIGDRHSWAKMDDATFSSLKKTLMDPEHAVRTSGDTILRPGLTRLLGLRTDGGFSEGAIHFSGDMNCFIGRLGAGKSSRIRQMGKALGLEQDYEPGKEEIYLFFEKTGSTPEDPHYCFHFGSGDTGPSYYRLYLKNGIVEEVEDPEEFGLTLPKIYDQKKIGKMQSSSRELLDFVSRHYFGKPTTTMDQKLLVKWCKYLTRKRNFDRNEIQEELKTALVALVEDKKKVLSDAKLKKEVYGELTFLLKGPLEQGSVHISDKLKNYAGQIGRIEADEKRVKKALDRLLDFKDQEKYTALASFRTIVFEDLDRRVLSKSLDELLKQKDISSATLRKEVGDDLGDKTLADELKSFLDDEKLDEKKEVREDYIREQALTSLAERLGKESNAKAAFTEAGAPSPDPARVREVYTNIHTLRSILAKQFEHHFRNEKGRSILALGIKKGSWDKAFKKAGTPEKLREILKEDPGLLDDVPELKLRVDGKLVKMDSLTDGQKAAAAMLTLMRQESFGPLIIDEPERHLDNECVFSHLVPRLRQLKGRQQVIMVTRNPNIPVAGDAENILVVEKKGAKKSEIAHNGAVDSPDVQREAVSILEGGDDAFRVRGLKYGLLD